MYIIKYNFINILYLLHNNKYLYYRQWFSVFIFLFFVVLFYEKRSPIQGWFVMNCRFWFLKNYWKLSFSIPQPNTSYMEANKPCNSGSFIRQYMQFLSHSRRSHSRRGKNSILLLFLKYKIWIIKLLSLSNPVFIN